MKTKLLKVQVELKMQGGVCQSDEEPKFPLTTSLSSCADHINSGHCFEKSRMSTSALE